MMGKEEYESWFNTLPEAARKKVCDCLGPATGRREGRRSPFYGL